MREFPDPPDHEVVLPEPGVLDLTAMGVVDPCELLAQRLARRVALLLPGLEQRSAEDRERFLDLLTGLSFGAEALYAQARMDDRACEDHSRAALYHLAMVDPSAHD